MSELALVPSAPLSDDELFEDAIAAEGEAEKAEAEAGSAARWRAADDYAEAQQRGYTQQQIAEKVGKSQGHISKCIACAEQYSPANNRPLFQAAYREKDGPGILGSSESNEWYTPAEYVESVRRVLGVIDLDPASCAEANEIVRADVFIPEANDGLAHEWHGRVFINPPYGRLCPLFMDKLRQEYALGHVEEAIALVSAYSTETRWFQPLFTSPICFPDHRLRGWPAPTFGSAFVYFGDNEGAFIEEFSQYGVIVRRVA